MEYLNDIFFTDATKYTSLIFIIFAILMLINIIEMWVLYQKLGEKGWKSIIPIYNCWVYMKLGDLPGWLSLIPVANIIGFIVVAFIIPKKVGKSPALGILYLFMPHLYYLIIILSNKKIEKESKNQTLTEDPKEKINLEFTEAPALNTEESIKEIPTTVNNAYINMDVKKEPEKQLDKDIINAFDIPVPNLVTEKDELVDTLTKLQQTDILEELDIQKNDNLEVLNTAVIDKDILEETVELPKMVNEEINSDIKATKHCNNCGFENEYSLKNCLMCGEPLE